MQKLTWISAVILALLIGILVGTYYPANYAPDTKDVISSAGSIATALTLIFLVVQNVINHKKQEEQHREQKEMLNLQKYENHLSLFHQRLNSITADERYHGVVRFQSKDLLYRKIFPSNNLSNLTLGLDPTLVKDDHLFTKSNRSLGTLLEAIHSISKKESPELSSFVSVINILEWLCQDLCIVISSERKMGTINSHFNSNHNINIYDLGLVLAVINGSFSQLKDFANYSNDELHNHVFWSIEFSDFSNKFLAAIYKHKYRTIGGKIIEVGMPATVKIDLGPEDVWLLVEAIVQTMLSTDLAGSDKQKLLTIRKKILAKLEQEKDTIELIDELRQKAYSYHSNLDSSNSTAKLLAHQLSCLDSFRHRQNEGIKKESSLETHFNLISGGKFS